MRERDFLKGPRESVASVATARRLRFKAMRSKDLRGCNTREKCCRKCCRVLQVLQNHTTYEMRHDRHHPAEAIRHRGRSRVREGPGRGRAPTASRRVRLPPRRPARPRPGRRPARGVAVAQAGATTPDAGREHGRRVSQPVEAPRLTADPGRAPSASAEDCANPRPESDHPRRSHRPCSPRPPSSPTSRPVALDPRRPSAPGAVARSSASPASCEPSRGHWLAASPSCRFAARARMLSGTGSARPSWPRDPTIGRTTLDFRGPRSMPSRSVPQPVRPADFISPLLTSRVELIVP